MTDALVVPEKTCALEFLLRNARSLAQLNDAIFYFAELPTQEEASAALLTGILVEKGFALTRNLSGFRTGFLAQFGDGTPIIALQLAYDAEGGRSQRPGVAGASEIVPGAPGHVRGRNVNAAATVAAALAIAEAMRAHHLKGTVRVYGAPGESVLASRSFYARDGHFADVDCAFHSRFGSTLGAFYGVLEPAAMTASWRFSPCRLSETAGAAVSSSPNHARLFFDAGLGQYREHLLPQCSIQRVDDEDVERPSDRVRWIIRSPDAETLRTTFEQVSRVAEGAALMANCTAKAEVRSAVWPLRGSEALAKFIQENIRAIGMPKWTKSEIEFAKTLQHKVGVPQVGLPEVPESLPLAASQSARPDDAGDISWTVPTGCLTFPGAIPGLPLDHWAIATTLATSIAYRGACLAAMVVAATVLDFMVEPWRVAEVKQAFRGETASTPYQSLLPNDALPMTDINGREMTKYRPLMKANYRSVEAFR